MRYRDHHRRAFTLVEMLVTMAIIVGLAAMTIMVSTWSLDRDRSATAVNQLQGAAQIARSRAHRDGLPYGIRIIDSGNQQAVSFQYIQSPPIFLPSLPPFSPGPYNVNSPYVQFDYTIDTTNPPPQQGQVITRQCSLVFPAGIPADQLAQLTPTSILSLPELGTYHFISAVTPLSPTTVSLTLNDPSLQLGYPDAQLGAATNYRTYYFGLFGPPQPVLGEEVMQLPQEVCVDLRGPSVAGGLGFSLPNTGTPPLAVPVDLDILFAPSGKLVGVPNGPNTGAYGHVFLWVHNPNKGAQPGPDLVDGGEQMIFVVKAQSGAVGTAPVDSGNPADPYDLARKAVAGH